MYRYRYPQLRQNLVGAWCPSLGATGPILLDQSGRGNHGTLTNMDPGTDWVASGGGGKSGLALDFDGTNDRVLTSSSTPHIATNRLTVSCWFRPNRLSRGDLVAKWFNGGAGPTGGDQFVLLYGVTSGKLAFYISQGGGAVGGAVGTRTLSTGQWYQAAGTYDQVNVSSWLDGTLNASTASSISLSTGSKAFSFGDDLNSDGTFQGLLDSIVVYDRVLTPSEIMLLARGRGIEHETVQVPVVRGATVSGGTGSLSATQAGNTLSAAGSLSIAGVLSTSQAGNTLSATGAVSIAGTVSTTQAGDTVSAAGTSGFTGSLSVTQASNTVSSAGTLALSGTSSLTQDGNTLSAAGTVASSGISGALTVTQAGNTVSSAGSISIAGVLSVTQAGNTLSAIGVSGDSALFATTVFGYYSTVEAW